VIIIFQSTVSLDKQGEVHQDRDPPAYHIQLCMGKVSYLDTGY
jgi:hypothetical protein